jgi:hypothetical protein
VEVDLRRLQRSLTEGADRQRQAGRLTTTDQYKLVWFVPREALERTRDAVFRAGGGRIGDYERCSWYAAGTGTFLGGVGTTPTVGEPGREQTVAELRVEVVVPAERASEVVDALVAAHPYEEVAFELYPLISLGRE